MEPHGLIERNPPRLGPEPSEDVSAHGQENDHRVDGEDQTSTSRYPYGKLKSVKRRQTGIASLFPPAVLLVTCIAGHAWRCSPSYPENCPVESPEEEVEGELLWRKEARPVDT
jgi:hypothetical protein